MAEAKANLKDATQHVQTLYTASTALTQAAKGLAGAFSKVSGEEVKLVDVNRKLSNASKEISSFGEVYKGVMERMSAPGLRKLDTQLKFANNAIRIALRDGRNARVEANEEIAKAMNAGVEGAQLDKLRNAAKKRAEEARNTAAESVKHHRQRLTQYYEQIQAHSKLANAVESFQKIKQEFKSELLGIPALYLAEELWKRIWATSVAYAEALEQSNSGLVERLSLMNKGLHAQIATGASLQETTEAMKQMVELGLEHNATLGEDLQTSLMMTRSLGVSSASAARLAQASAMTGTSMSKMADLVTVVAEMTALSAEEATKMAAELGRAMRVWLPAQQRGGYAGAAGELMLFAGALKEAGGVAEDITKLTTDILSARNLTAAAMLGVDMRMMGTKEGAQQMKVALAGLSKELQGNVFMTQAYAKMLGVSAETLATASDALEKENKLRAQYGDLMDANGKLQERYNRQMADSGQAYEMLKNSLNALLGDALLPFNYILTIIARAITSVIQALSKNAGVIKVVSGLLSVGVAAVVIGVIAAFAKIYSSIMHFAGQLKLLAIDIQMAAQKISKGGTGTTFMGGVSGPTAGMGKTGKIAAGAGIAGIVTMVLGGLLSEYGGEWGAQIGGWVSAIGGVVSTLAMLAPVIAPLITAIGAAVAGMSALALVTGGAIVALAALAVGTLAYQAWKLSQDVAAEKESRANYKQSLEGTKQVIRNMAATSNNFETLQRVTQKMAETEEGRLALNEAIMEAESDYQSSSDMASAISTGLGGFASSDQQAAIAAPVAAAAAKFVAIKGDEKAANAIMQGNKTQEEVATAVKKANDITSAEGKERAREQRRRMLAAQMRGLKSEGVVLRAKAEEWLSPMESFF